ncbi:MAG: hypothetical protein WDA08_02125 [Weeksellaceae bacterium]
MSAFGKIKLLWSVDGKNKMSANTICLYAFLISKLIDTENQEARISDKEISKAFSITQKTIYRSRENLQRLGLIDYQLQNGVPCYYRLGTKLNNNISENTIQKKAKAINGNIPKSQIPDHPPKTTEPKISITRYENQRVRFDVPTMNEFKEFAKTLPDYDPKLDVSIEGKFEKWEANGWKNDYGRPINSWKASLKSTWPYMLRPLTNHPIDMNNIPNIKRPRTTYNED